MDGLAAGHHLREVPVAALRRLQELVRLGLVRELQRLRVEVQLLAGEAQRDAADEQRLGERGRVGELRAAARRIARLTGLHELAVVVVAARLVARRDRGVEGGRVAGDAGRTARVRKAERRRLRADHDQAVVRDDGRDGRGRLVGLPLLLRLFGLLGLGVLAVFGGKGGETGNGVRRRQQVSIEPRELDGVRNPLVRRERHLDTGLLRVGDRDGALAVGVGLDGHREAKLERPERRIGVVDGHVADRAAAVIPPPAPAEGVIGAREAVVRARAAPAVPGVRRIARRKRLGLRIRLHALRPHRAVGPAVELLHVAPHARVAQRLVAPHARMALVAHLADDARLELRLEHELALLDGAGERLLHVDVLAGEHAVHGDVGVRVVRRADLHDLELVAHRLEHVAVVRELRNAGVLLLPAVERARVDVAHRDKLAARRDEAFRRGPAHAPAADGGELQAATLHLALERGLRGQVDAEHGAERKGAQAGDEVAAIDLEHLLSPFLI